MPKWRQILGSDDEMKTAGISRYITLLILIASCHGEVSYHGGFSETIEITTQKANFDSILMRYPYRIKATETSLYVVDIHPVDYFCHEFDYPSIKYRNSFAKKGKGPQEVSDISNIIVNNAGTTYLLNLFERKIYARDGNGMDVITVLPEELTQCVDFMLYNDSIFIIPDYSGKNRLVFADRNGNIVRRIGEIPAKEKAGIPEVALSQAWRPFIHYNPRNGLLAMVTQFGEVLELYDFQNDHVQVRVGPGGEPKCRYKGAAAYPNGIRGYSDVFVGDKYIYALFWGYEYAKVLSGEITYSGGDLIHVFDLEGKPVRQYHIDRHITGFCVNETTGEVIGTDVNNEQLVMFEL